MTVLIKVLFNNVNINQEEVIGLTSIFNYFLIVNNAEKTLKNEFNGIKNFEILNNYNKGGLAGAYNLAFLKLVDINPKYVLFLDDDTPLKQLYDIYDDHYYFSFNDKSVAAVSPSYIDSNSKTRGSHIFLNKFTFTRLPRNFIGISNVSFMINSCSVWRFEAIKEIGKYDEQLQIDHIDTDYCLRAVEMGYSLILNSNYSFAHKIGDRITYSFLFNKFRSGNHSPARRNMIMKNSILVLRKHIIKFPVFSLIISERIIYELMGIVLAETQKFEKIKMSIRGLCAGLLSRRL